MAHCQISIALSALGVAGLFGACSSESDAPANRPNLVLIVVDTLRADFISGEAAKKTKTPAIDALVQDGIRFERAFSHAPITLPSHTALFSSRAPFETGVMNNGHPVRENLPLLAEWLNEYGYATQAVISLGTLNLSGDSNVERGFDHFDRDFWRMDQGPAIVDRTRPHLDRLQADQPFFLFAHFSDPHEPYNAHGTLDRRATVFFDGEEIETVTTAEMTIWEREFTLEPGEHLLEVTSADRFKIRGIECRDENGVDLKSKWVQPEKRLIPTTDAKWSVSQESSGPRKVFLRMWINDQPKRSQKILRYRKEVEYVDKYVGALIDDLKQRGLYDNSLILFTSDHGEELAERDHVGHIHTLYDEQLHVPLVIKLPQGDTRSKQLEVYRQNLVPHMDLVPTVLDLMGVPALSGQRGRSLLQEAPSVLIAQTHKIQAHHDLICLRDDRFKMIYVADEKRFEMYDLVTDPGELDNVYEARSGERPDWAEKLERFAGFAAEGGLALEDMDPALLAELEALGYVAN